MNIVVAQSGGPTCAINASLLGVIKEAMKTPNIDAIFGSINGIEGIINDRLINLKTVFRSNYDMELLRQTPSTVLGSCRYKLPDYEDNDEVYEKITACLEKHRIEIFLYIGGNDSMDTVNKLSEYFRKNDKNIRVMGIPKTIDNDLCCTDHSPGFGSAAKYVTTAVQEIICDSSVYSINSVTIIETMGRHAGWLTASSCVLRAMGEEAPHLFYLPESKFSSEQFIDDVLNEMAKHKAVIVAVSEGISLQSETGYRSGIVDCFGHEYLSGVGKCLESMVSGEIGCKVRSIELNVMQRCASHSASKTDIDEAEQIGSAGLSAALSGETGKVMVFNRISDVPYLISIGMADASQVANHEKFMPKEWINERGNNISDDAIKYYLPLIQGELNLKMHNGIPQRFKLS